MEPTQKDEAIDNLLTLLMGKSRPETVRAGKCMTCDGDAAGFRDDLSRREYQISGMCQRCQDDVFSK